ncbi:MAG: YHS domain-containing (seleno)protein [Pseudolabrys sp.]
MSAGGIICGVAGAAPVSVDPQNGVAISGYDPVAYFTDASAQAGRPELELSRDGTIWRFRNEGNRAAFAERPDVYSPRFGGYDPVAIARGASVPGHPLFWLVSGQRLYLFYSTQARAAFAADPDRIIEAAERKWPAVQRTLP